MNAVEQELIQIQQDLCAAWMHKDRVTIERILAPEWSHSDVPGSFVFGQHSRTSSEGTESLWSVYVKNCSPPCDE